MAQVLTALQAQFKSRCGSAQPVLELPASCWNSCKNNDSGEMYNPGTSMMVPRMRPAARVPVHRTIGRDQVHFSEGDLVSFPCAAVQDFRDMWLDPDNPDRALGEVTEVDLARFMPVRVRMSNGHSRYFTEDRVILKTLDPNHAAQLRNELTAAAVRVEAESVDGIVFEEHALLPDEKAAPPPPEAMMRWAEAQLRAWRRSQKRSQPSAPTENVSELIQQACDASGHSFESLKDSFDECLFTRTTVDGPFNLHSLSQRQRAALYSRLGLSSGASWDSVRSFFPVCAWQRHPDRGGTREEFIEVLRAYDAISRLESAKVVPRLAPPAPAPGKGLATNSVELL